MAETTNDHGPQYYRRGPVQVWDFVRQQELNFHLGNVIKYVCRAGHKNDDIEDLSKAIHYLSNEIEFRTSQRVQRSVPSKKLTESQLEEYAAELNN